MQKNIHPPTGKKVCISIHRRLDLEAEDPFDGSFDLIYSRDCFMHIVGKAEMYKKIKVYALWIRTCHAIGPDSN